jgi:hypothetical protein
MKCPKTFWLEDRDPPFSPRTNAVISETLVSYGQATTNLVDEKEIFTIRFST